MFTQLDRVKRNQAIKRITELIDTAKRAKDDTNQVRIFSIRYRQLPTLIDTLEETYLKLMVTLTDPAIIETEEIQHSMIYAMRVDAVAIYEELFPEPNEAKNSAENSSNHNSMSVRSSNLRLPKLELKQFSGNYREWSTFIDFFNSCIHQNTSLSNIERFQYLVSSLSQEPLALVRGFPLSDSNYSSAYDALVERYQNKRRLAFAHWEAIRSVTLTTRSATGLRRMLNTITENLTALNNLGFPIKHWDFILFHTLLIKLDVGMREAFEKQNVSSGVPSFESLKTFVGVQCQAIELSRDFGSDHRADTSSTKGASHSESAGHRATRSVFVADVPSLEVCGACQGQHRITQCHEFRDKSPQDRFEFAKLTRLCINCLRLGHRAIDCPSKKRCQLCGVLHNTLLHFNQRDVLIATPGEVAAPSHSLGVSAELPLVQCDSVPEHIFANTIPSTSNVLLSTVCVQIRDLHGNWQEFRALLDSASEINVISENCVRRLELPRVKTSLSMRGLSPSYLTSAAKVACIVRGSAPRSDIFELEAYVVPEICGKIPKSCILPNNWTHIANVSLADSSFHVPGPVDMLLGTAVFAQIILSGRLSGNDDEPVALSSKWGYILMGRVPGAHHESDMNKLGCNVSEKGSLNSCGTVRVVLMDPTPLKNEDSVTPSLDVVDSEAIIGCASYPPSFSRLPLFHSDALSAKPAKYDDSYFLMKTGHMASLPVPVLANLSTATAVVMLSTARIEVFDVRGQRQTVRALVDSGSQVNVITERCVRRLGLLAFKSELPIHGLGQLKSTASSVVSLIIRGKTPQSPSLSIEAYVMTKICGDIPSSPINSNNWRHLGGIPWADPSCCQPGTIDVLLGADVFCQILRDGRRIGGPTEPLALNTSFGWLLLGRVSQDKEPFKSICIALEPSLENNIKRFWEIENLPAVEPISPLDEQCEEIFINTHRRDSNGRYIVNLPFTCAPPMFTESRAVAVRRFYSLERRLLRDTDLYDAYRAFMKDYLEAGHMEPVTEVKGSEYYIPHHCVVKPQSISTKLRVVFDASARTPDGRSLNASLLTGNKLQLDIVSILLKFRLHSVVFTADIRQMYRQILIAPSHRDFQRIVWRPFPQAALTDYRLRTVTYGVASAPFLALRTIGHLIHDEGDNFPNAARVLASDVYVDDIVTGCETEKESIGLQNELIDLLKRGGFELRKWSSNRSSVLAEIEPSHRLQQPLSFDSEDDIVIKILGLRWHPSRDIFMFDVTAIDRVCTKRNLLSEVAKIFDPLGFLTPMTLVIKVLIQNLWTLGLDWDDIPPQETLDKWEKYKSQLSCMSKWSIPRRLMIDNVKNCQIHGFCDASERGYAAVIYLRLVSSSNSIHSTFVVARSKVAPLKQLSIPRLELCAAYLLSELIHFVQSVYAERFVVDRICAWTDSTVVLAWVKSHPSKWKTFVSNRVNSIQERVPASQWFHVRSADNPADCGSRTLMPSDLIDFDLWWNGPNWLRQEEIYWPKQPELTPSVQSTDENILDKFNPGARQMITAGKTYLKALHGAAAASRLYVDAIGKLGRQAQQGTWGGSADIGTALMKVVEVYREIQDQQMNILKAFYVDLLVPLETNLEKDTKVVQSEQKRFMQQHKLRSESYSKAAAAIKKQRKKNTRNASKAGTAMDKELKIMQVLEEEKTKMDAFCEQSLKNAMTQERRRYGFVLERQCSLAKHWLAYHGGGAASYQAGLEEWQDVARTREFLPPTVESMFVSRMRQVSFWSDDDEGAAGERGEESVYACPGAALRKARSVDASCLDVRSIGALANDELGSEMGLARAKSDFDLHDTSMHAMQQDSHLTPNRRPNSFAPPPPQPAAWEAPLARALYAYMSSGDNQLSFLEGDLVALHGDRTKGWQYGENMRTQQAGWFPLAYTEIITDQMSGSPARWGSSQGPPPQTPVPSVASTPVAAASTAPTSHAANASDAGVLGMLADESRNSRMFGDTLVAHRNSKQMRRVTGSSSGQPGPGPAPTLPAPVPAPSVPTKLPHSQSASFHAAPAPSPAHPGKAATMKTSASSANFTSREETKNSFGPQTLPMRGQVGVNKGTPKGVAAVGNVSLHSSNDSGFSNEPPPQPEIDYSDEEGQHRNRMPIRNGQSRSQDEARFMKTQSLKRDSKLNGTQDNRDRKPHLTDDQQLMLRTMLEMDKDSHKVKRTKSFWKFGRTTSQEIMEGMSLWQHRDLVDTVPEYKKKFYAKIQEAILSTQLEAKENGYDSSDSTLKNGESNYPREKPSQTIDRKEILQTMNGIRQSKSLSSIQNANVANREREVNNSPNKESTVHHKKKSVSDKSISKDKEEDFNNSRHDRQSNHSDFTNTSTIKTNFENSFYDDENGGGLMVKTVKRQDILQRYDNNTSESDNNSVSSSTDPYDCIIVDDHMTTTGRKHKEIEQQRKTQKVSTEHSLRKSNPNMYAPEVDESEICLIKPQVRATLSSDRKKSGKMSQHEPQPHPRAIETFKTFKDSESELKSLSESTETLKYIDRGEVDESYFDNSHGTLPKRKDQESARTRKEDKQFTGNGDDTLKYNKNKRDERFYRTKESEQIKYRDTPGRNIDTTKSTKRERSYSDYYRGPDGDTLKYNREQTRKEEKYYSSQETDSKKAAKSKRYYDYQEEERRRLFMEQQTFMRSNGEGTKYNNTSEQSDDQKYDEAMRQQKPQLLPRTKLLKTSSTGAGAGAGATMQTVMKFEQEIGLMTHAQSKREMAATELRDLAAAELRDFAASDLPGSGHTFGPWYDLWGVEGGPHHK